MFRSIVVLLLLILSGCSTQTKIVYSLPEREANEIVVLLASKGIEAEKNPAAVSSVAAGSNSQQTWDITVRGSQVTDALAVLNQAGLPRVRGTNLLDLFGTNSLVPSDTQDKIRYQEGLSEQLASTIRKMDGVLDADVQFTMPRDEEDKAPITSSVYIKHRGILDNPNSTLITKIKRFVANAVPGMSIDNVSVIADRAILSETLWDKDKGVVAIWGILISKSSVGLFRLIFYMLLLTILLLIATLAWVLWKILPIIEAKGPAWFLHTEQWTIEKTSLSEEK